jgi:DNA-3-methyladenine glycosylase I
MNQTRTGPDGRLQCGWSLSAPEFLHFHDREWGFSVAGDRPLFGSEDKLLRLNS